MLEILIKLLHHRLEIANSKVHFPGGRGIFAVCCQPCNSTLLADHNTRLDCGTLKSISFSDISSYFFQCLTINNQ